MADPLNALKPLLRTGRFVELLQAIEWTARIPMAASVESLNAAISVAIALYAWDGDI